MEIKSIKKASDGGLQIKWTETKEEDGMVKNYDHDDISPDIPHRDLTQLFDKLKAPLLKTWGFFDLLTVRDKGTISKEEREAFMRIDKYISGIQKGNMEKLDITGVTFSGDNLDKVKITGKYDDIAGVAMAMNSPLIHCDRDTYQVESTVGEIAEQLKDEAEQYLKGKHVEPTQATIE